MQKLQSESMDRLMEVISKLSTKEECQNFFEDICTIKELQDMAQRLDVAILLRQGVNYQSIAQQVNVSTATISRVNKCLKYGNEGYLKVLDDIDKADKRRNLYDGV